MVFTVSNVTNMNLLAFHTAVVGVRTVPGPTIAPRWIVDTMVVVAANPTWMILGIVLGVTSVECVRVSDSRKVW